MPEASNSVDCATGDDDQVIKRIDPPKNVLDVAIIPKQQITVGGEQDPARLPPPKQIYTLGLPEAEIEPSTASLMALSSQLHMAAFYLQECGVDVVTPIGDSVIGVISRVGRTLQNMARNA